MHMNQKRRQWRQQLKKKEPKWNKNWNWVKKYRKVRKKNEIETKYALRPAYITANNV